jgi:hypothetical protein
MKEVPMMEMVETQGLENSRTSTGAEPANESEIQLPAVVERAGQ